ncbi:MAG TPA: class I SAM-dependent methyltransferase [Melioribacteraceae bacterium]|nr:class I SAM-dependent methyltransferase [Melioribacteraceae bacterium]
MKRTKNLLKNNNLFNKLYYKIPRQILDNQKQINDNELNELKFFLIENYYKNKHPFTQDAFMLFENDLLSHLMTRLQIDRKRIIPWLNTAKPLTDSTVLEIGCGTGSSTVALAEQGAKVTGIDIEEESITVAKKRCSLYKVEAHFKVMNAVDLIDSFINCKFDFIIFFASLEHMTVRERITAIKQAWNLLNKNGILSVIETPNRLWYYDIHTSQLPFFHWLPDDLAYYYSRKSKRNNFRELYMDESLKNYEHFLRRGRGVSFHEFELAIESFNKIKTISSLSSFENIFFRMNIPKQKKIFKSFIMNLYPGIHHGFFDEILNINITKDF